MSIHTPEPNARGSYFRSVILAELSSRDLSRTWLANTVSTQTDAPCCSANIFSYLRGKSDCTGEVLHSIFQVLDLRLTRY